MKREKLIEDFVDTETAVARKKVQDSETAIIQEQEDMRNAEKAQSTTRKPETSFDEMLNAIRDNLGDLASSDNEEYREYDKDDAKDTVCGKLGEEVKAGCMLGTISKTG